MYFRSNYCKAWWLWKYLAISGYFAANYKTDALSARSLVKRMKTHARPARMRVSVTFVWARKLLLQSVKLFLYLFYFYLYFIFSHNFNLKYLIKHSYFKLSSVTEICINDAPTLVTWNKTHCFYELPDCNIRLVNQALNNKIIFKYLT